MISTQHTPSAAPSVFFDARRKRFQDRSSERDACVCLDASGMITNLTPEARHLLEYDQQDPIEPCFFSHVHGKNQYQVMRDVADMIVHGKHVTTWFLRLRTGRKRWQWYRASAFNDLAGRNTIVVRLSEATPEW